MKLYFLRRENLITKIVRRLFPGWYSYWWSTDFNEHLSKLPKYESFNDYIKQTKND